MSNKDYSYYLNKYEKFLTYIKEKSYGFIQDKETLDECVQYSFIEFISKYEGMGEKSLTTYINTYYFSFLFREILNSIDSFDSYEDKISLSLKAILKVEDKLVEPVTMEKIAKYYGIDRNTRYSIINYAKNYIDLLYYQDSLTKDREINIEDSIVERVYAESMKKKLNKSFNSLKENPRDIISKKLGLNDEKEKTYASIAKEYNCTTYNVQLMYERAIKRLGKKLEKTLK